VTNKGYLLTYLLTQGDRNQHGSICRLWLPINVP